MRVRIYFGENVIWYYQIIYGQATANSLIYGYDRRHEEKMAAYNKSLSYGLAQRRDKKDITLTFDRRHAIKS